MSILKKILLLSIFLQSHLWTNAQNPRIDSLLQNISRCQRSYSDSLYQKGLFPSKRIYLHRKNYKRDDDNIFFTGMIVWTLRSQQTKMNEANKVLTDSICARAVQNYVRYQNKQGDCSYNFWQTNPSRHFPNDDFFSKRKKHSLPDDLDDTSVLYLSESQPDSLITRLKDKMGQHTNGYGRWIYNTFRKYKHRRAYNTWFGKRMRVDYDLSVQCNAMLWVLNNKLPFNQFDFETIRLIEDMVLANEHIRYAHYVSPHYQKPAIVLYHLARLVSAHPATFPRIKDKIVLDIENELKKSQVSMEKLLLNTSLARFGIAQKESPVLTEKDFNNFYFFVANLSSIMPNPIKRWFAKNSWTNFYYQCEGYYWTLLLENECMKF
jgi:hypothetical protein